MRGRSAVPACLVVVAALVSSCAHVTEGDVGSRPPALSPTTASTSSLPASSPSATSPSPATDDAVAAPSPVDGTISYPGLLRVVGVYRSCADEAAVDISFATASQLTRRVRLVARDLHGRVLRSASHTLPVTVSSEGDGAVQMRGTRATWRLAPAAGPPLPRSEASGWTVALVADGSSRDLARPTPVTMPSCAAGTWAAPLIRLAVSEVSRDCTAVSPVNEYVSVRVRATGLVYGLGYRVEGTGLGDTVGAMPPFGTSVDRVMRLSPMPDESEGAGLPPPFPTTAFTAIVRLQAQDPDEAFTRAERSADVLVHVPACQPGSSANPRSQRRWTPRLPARPTP